MFRTPVIPLQKDGVGGVIDIVIPVYRGLDETRRCLTSLLNAQCITAYEVMVIDDASPDVEIVEYLSSLAERGSITLLRNPENIGFVGSVNRGMALHPERDVVLLNSDTEVVSNWLDRLRRCAISEPNVGTVTPFSNNATICSFPVFCADNALPADYDLETLDALFALHNAGMSLDIPSAVGFCMYIRRDCLTAVGAFDQKRFGKGYGEENDFSRRAAKAGWRNVLCADTFVFHQGSVSFGVANVDMRSVGVAQVASLHPEYTALIETFVATDPVAPLRRRVEIAMAVASVKSSEVAFPINGLLHKNTDVCGAQLHVIHRLGGGVQKWLQDFIEADTERRNWVLRPVTKGGDMAQGLALYDQPGLEALPCRFWLLANPIAATAANHPEYREILATILRDYDIGAILVSSLIGHALNVLDTGLPTCLIHHDFYPYCPAINIHFGTVCRQCDPEKLAACHTDNPAFNVCFHFALDDKLAVRQDMLLRLAQGRLISVAPTHSVFHHLEQLDRRLTALPHVVIPHGQPRIPSLAVVPNERSGRLRVLLLGRLSESKGAALLFQGVAEMTRFADVYLLGAGIMSELLRDYPGVTVIESYAGDGGALSNHVQQIDPHLGLLLSIWPETYSYTLTELMMLGVPPVATDLGAFRERIEAERTGFLFEPTCEAMLHLLRELDADRTRLRKVREQLTGLAFRSSTDMVADYRALLPGARGFDASCCDQPKLQELSGDVQQLWLELATCQAQRGELAERMGYREQREAALQVSLAAAEDRCKVMSNKMASQVATLAQLNVANAHLQQELQAVLASTSWRMSAPVRVLGRTVLRMQWAKYCLARLLASPGKGMSMLGRVFTIARTGGLAAAKTAILQMPSALQADEAAQAAPVINDTLTRFTWFISQLLRLPALPRISILTPTFNTPEPMLRAMLDSVLTQIYPNWQLCIADDASTDSHVRAVLESYAARDRRIKLDFAFVNGGSSKATNRALSMATGSYVVLLDHDDLLEDQALFRVAEAVLEDDPDMLYSDEVLVGEDGDTVEHFIFRPAFSPEYLRSHPYIVHLVGFKPCLLRKIGGFDETLRISQDYDLILRASEQAGTITHIPEILYRWRIHGNSAGHQMIGRVMETSKAILQRHLQRCGEAGEVGDGPSFNFFDVRYPLSPALKVAIVIPTKNHGDLVRACIDSIERTVLGVKYEIVLIDHESDDPASLSYFENIRSRVTLLRYSGPFNFAAINNWAVAQLDGSHTHYLFCNNDIEAIEPGWLERMLELGQKPDVGIVGAKLYYPDGKTIQHAGVVVACCGVAENLGRFRLTSDDPLDLGYSGSLICNREVSAVTGACLLIRQSVFEAIGGFDETIAVGYGDVDLCLRVGEKGYRVLFCAKVALLHHESFTRGRSQENPHPEDSERFVEKWQALFEGGDSYFSPNLSPHSPNWQVADDLEFKLDIRRRIFKRVLVSHLK